MIFGDITNEYLFSNIDKDIDAVFHFAAERSIEQSVINPIKNANTNIVGFLNVLEFVKNRQIKKFIYASSSSIYGNVCQNKFDESFFNFQLNPYALSKYVNELYAELYFRIHKVNSIGLRYFNVYGKYQDYYGNKVCVIPKFIKQIRNDEVITINGKYTKRDFTYIDDVINANILALNSKKKGFNIYNVGSENPIKIIDVAKLIAKYLNKELKYEIKSLSPIEMEKTYSDNSHINYDFGFENNVKFEEGLRRTVEWYIKNF